MALVALAALNACGTEGDPEEAEFHTEAVPQYEIRDSAGIRIIENRRPPGGSRLGWQIGAEPVLTIGSVSGEESFQLHRVDDALKLADGRLVIANGGSHQLLVFDGAGNHLTAWGQKGEGPGDFGGEWGGDALGFRLFWAEPWPGDSIAVCHGTFSLGLELLSVFDLAGRHARTVNLASDASRTRCREVFSDGSILASREPRWSGYPPTGMQRDQMDFFLLEGDGTLRAELGSHPGAEEFYYLDNTVFPPFSFWMPDPPFQQTVAWGAWNGLAIVSSTDRYEIRAYRSDGSLGRIVRRDHAVQPPTETDLESYRTDRLALNRSPEYREMMIPVLDALEVPSSFPAFSTIEVDALGYLWVREYNLPGDHRAFWTVFDPDGIVQGFVETPSGLTIYEIGADYILGRRTGEMDVESVELWGLTRCPESVGVAESDTLCR